MARRRSDHTLTLSFGLSERTDRRGSFTRTVLGTIAEATCDLRTNGLEQIERLESDRKDTLDSRGLQHHEEKRLAILGFAIKELVLQCEVFIRPAAQQQD